MMLGVNEYLNEAGEPIMSAEQMYAEQRADAEPYWCPDCHTTHPFALDGRNCDNGCGECGDHAPLYFYKNDERICRDCYIFDQGEGFMLATGANGTVQIEDCRDDFRVIAYSDSVADAREVAFLLAVGRRYRNADVVQH